jgi:hypothetical protein
MKLTMTVARAADLEAMSRLDKQSFPKYAHVFSLSSLRKWFHHNRRMFIVARDDGDELAGFAAVVPLKKKLFEAITSGAVSSLVDFPEAGVLKKGKSSYYHIEVIVTKPGARLRSGLQLLGDVVDAVMGTATYVTASPITAAGERLCKYFGFRKVARDRGQGHYPIYLLVVDRSSLSGRTAALARKGVGAHANELRFERRGMSADAPLER